MSEISETEAKKRSRLRWVTLGESIAIAALIISGLGLWREFTKPDEKPVVVEKTSSIPLTLRGRAQDEGRSLEITPVENSHALQSLAITTGASKIELGSDGTLDAKTVENALGKSVEKDEAMHRLRVRIEAKYVEGGADKSATGSYMLAYRWEGGGFLGGRSLRLTGLSR
jgi:hypothetical protein